jgi:hypothetical protein
MVHFVSQQEVNPIKEFLAQKHYGTQLTPSVVFLPKNW